MNLYFFLNLTLTLTIVNSITFVFTQRWQAEDIMLNIGLIALVVAFVWVRGRYSVMVKETTVTVNHFPLSCTLATDNIACLIIKDNSVQVEQTGGSIISYRFFFKPRTGVKIDYPALNIVWEPVF